MLLVNAFQGENVLANSQQENLTIITQYVTDGTKISVNLNRNTKARDSV